MEVDDAGSDLGEPEESNAENSSLVCMTLLVWLIFVLKKH
jgi:hypothetical protein